MECLGAGQHSWVFTDSVPLFVVSLPSLAPATWKRTITMLQTGLTGDTVLSRELHLTYGACWPV